MARRAAATPESICHHILNLFLINIIIMTVVSKEKRMRLAVEAFNKGQFQSKSACVRAFNIPPRTLLHRLNGMTSRKESIANSQKLLDIKEETLSKWILNICQRGLPLRISNVRHLTQLLLSARLKASKNATIGEQ